ncbi:MAG: Hpt domain-containing protein [Bacteroidales bacterium]|nr:Hpt domain-containing protein [Bacteroidales bacterium]
MENVPPIDMEDFLERLPSKDLIKKLLDSFIESYQEFIDEIRISITNGNAKEIRESAHKLKGVLANLSIKKGCQLVLDLEKNADSINKDDALEMVSEIENEIIRVKSYSKNNAEFFN